LQEKYATSSALRLEVFTGTTKGVNVMQNHTTKKPSTFSRAVEENVEEQIRIRAYELFEARGREADHDLEDWLEAEAEITGATIRTAA
jgi:Protein of unknown function (DUF2934)